MTKENAQQKQNKKASSSAKASNTNHPFFDQAKKMQEQMRKINPFADQTETMMNKMNTQAKQGFDRRHIFNMHKKNMEALNEANTMAVNVMQQIAQLQGRFMEQTFQDIDQIIQENLEFKMQSPEEQFANNSKHMKNAVDRAVAHSNSISQIMLKSNQDLFKNVQNRFEEGMREMHDNINKTKH